MSTTGVNPSLPPEGMVLDILIDDSYLDSVSALRFLFLLPILNDSS